MIIQLLKAMIGTFRHLLLLLGMLLVVSIKNVSAQQAQPTQTIRGTVTDKVSQTPMTGAAVVVLGTVPVKGATADLNGQFIIRDVPVGRQNIKVTYMGYKEVVISNLTVNAGKEVVLTVQMEEDIMQGKEVVIKGKIEKHKAMNEMAVVSARTFSVEETQKFAAAVNDPARMATSFAGVVGGHDGNNMISVRGNSPNGLLWKMEGMDIPNPNHFSSVGTSGGGISILSAQLLGNSDFMTGAFPAEYGNALGGVFDLKLRKGNNQKREYTLQAGVLGIDVATEGPFKKGYDGSYLINYRYSTLSLLGLMGVAIVGDNSLDFQDLSFNVSLPTKKFGTFGIYGMGGLSYQNSKEERDSSVWKEEGNKRYPSTFLSNTGVFGINNVKLFGTKTYVKTSVTASGTRNAFYEKKLNTNYDAIENYEESYVQSRLAISSVATHKFNAKNSLRAGFILSYLGFNLFQKEMNDSLQVMQTHLDVKGNTSTLQTFAQWNHKFNTRLSTNMGVHLLYLNLNGSYSVEPRASVRYELTGTQSVALGYGLHSQIQPLGAYFSKAPNGNGDYLNKNLGLSKAHHFVAAYDINIDAHTHIKTETYYQHLFNIPISADPTKTFSMLNVVEGYNTDPLTNKGLGRNYGLELTVERFLHKNLYYLLSMSVYESKYKAADNNWYNTRFNTNFATTLTAGKEWELSEKHKKKVIGVNTKIVYIGGLRRTAIDLPASVAKGETVYDDAHAFEIKNPDYFRIDIRLSLKRNFAKSTSTISLDIQNLTARENVAGQYFDENTGTIKYSYQVGLLPILSYRLEF